MSKATNTAFLTAGALLATGVLAFAPISGELDPPEGPVVETTPSLHDLSLQIDGVSSALASPFPDGLRSAFDTVGGNQMNETVEFIPTSEGEFVRIYSVTVSASRTNMKVGASDERIFSLSGSAVLGSGQVTGSTHAQLGGLRVPTPVRFQTGGQDSASTITVLYWVE